MIAFPKSPRIDYTTVARRRVWVSKCGRYRIEHHQYDLVGMAPVWFVLVTDRGWGWRILSRHRLKSAAFGAVEKHARAAVVREVTKRYVKGRRRA